jgi:hypothetical protein
MKLPVLLTLLAGCAAAQAQTRVLFLDRTTPAVWAVDDLSGDGSIQEPGELFAYFNNTTGVSPPLSTPGAIAVRPSDGLVAVADSSASVRGVFFLRDFNRNNAALDPGESWLAVGLGNASGVTLNAPLGLAFDNAGNLYVSNSGATGTQDAIYKLTDLDADGRFMSPGEVTEFVGAPFYGPGNTAYVPAAIALDLSRTPFVGYVKDSGASTAGVYRFSDANGNGRADDPGETTVFINGSNASGVAVPAGGLTLCLDAARPNTVYFTQIASGVRQLVRASDLNNNGNAMDPGEAQVVWSTSEALTIIDILSLPDGRVMLSDASTGNKRVLLLTDANNDGLFDNATERSVYYAASIPGGVRQLAMIPRYCAANCDQSTTTPVLNVLDFACFLNAFAAGDLYANCDSSTTPPVLNVLDFACFLNKFAAGCT